MGFVTVDTTDRLRVLAVLTRRVCDVVTDLHDYATVSVLASEQPDLTPLFVAGTAEREQVISYTLAQFR
jgi:hypothetical protein